MSIEDVARPTLRRVRIRNYKSIGQADVHLGPLTVLVGRNGAGKSNFLNALSFVTDALGTSLDFAIQTRGGIDAVRRHSTGHPRNFSIELELALPAYRSAVYGFEIAARQGSAFVVKEERLRLVKATTGEAQAHFRRAEGRLEDVSIQGPPPVAADRLYLVNAAGWPDFREVFDALLAMGFYNLSPEAMRELQSPDAGELLRPDGANVASVVGRLRESATLDRITGYLGAIVPGLTRVERSVLGPRETLRFWQKVEGSHDPWKFFATSMSDGTLRALGALVAVMQLVDTDKPVVLVGIEEPETALHPAAAGALIDALREAATHTQVVVTSHSPDLLDLVNPEEDALLVVGASEGTTSIAPVDETSRTAIRDHLLTVGELLRQDLLHLDPADLERQARQLSLFEAPVAA